MGFLFHKVLMLIRDYYYYYYYYCSFVYLM